MNWWKRLFGGGTGEHTGSGGNGAEGNGSSGPAPEMVTCQEALERLYEYLDGELVPTEEGQVEAHFRVCQRCYPHLQFERSFLSAVQGVSEDAEASDDLKSRVLETLRSEGLDVG